ncbi:hypothetical protein D9M69_581540 [compost metagenome]
MPSDGSVGGMPTPRKLSVASIRIARPRFRVAVTMTGVSVLGRMCVNMMRSELTRIRRAACTYSLPRSTRAEARTVRAYCTQLVMEMARIRITADRVSRMPGGSSWRNTAVTRIATRMVGMLSSVSPRRIKALSTQPPK